MYRFECKKDDVGHIAIAYLEETGEIAAAATGFGEKDAVKKLKIRLGLASAPVFKKYPPAKRRRGGKGAKKHNPKGSVMTGLAGKTESSPWEYVK